MADRAGPDGTFNAVEPDATTEDEHVVIDATFVPVEPVIVAGVEERDEGVDLDALLGDVEPNDRSTATDTDTDTDDDGQWWLTEQPVTHSDGTGLDQGHVTDVVDVDDLFGDPADTPSPTAGSPVPTVSTDTSREWENDTTFTPVTVETIITVEEPTTVEEQAPKPVPVVDFTVYHDEPPGAPHPTGAGTLEPAVGPTEADNTVDRQDLSADPFPGDDTDDDADVTGAEPAVEPDRTGVDSVGPKEPAGEDLAEMDVDAFLGEIVALDADLEEAFDDLDVAFQAIDAIDGDDLSYGSLDDTSFGSLNNTTPPAPAADTDGDHTRAETNSNELVDDTNNDDDDDDWDGSRSDNTVEFADLNDNTSGPGPDDNVPDPAGLNIEFPDPDDTGPGTLSHPADPDVTNPEDITGSSPESEEDTTGGDIGADLFSELDALIGTIGTIDTPGNDQVTDHPATVKPSTPEQTTPPDSTGNDIDLPDIDIDLDDLGVDDLVIDTVDADTEGLAETVEEATTAPPPPKKHHTPTSSGHDLTLEAVLITPEPEHNPDPAPTAPPVIGTAPIEPAPPTPQEPEEDEEPIPEEEFNGPAVEDIYGFPVLRRRARVVHQPIPTHEPVNEPEPEEHEPVTDEPLPLLEALNQPLTLKTLNQPVTLRSRRSRHEPKEPATDPRLEAAKEAARLAEREERRAQRRKQQQNQKASPLVWVPKVTKDPELSASGTVNRERDLSVLSDTSTQTHDGTLTEEDLTALRLNITNRERWEPKHPDKLSEYAQDARIPDLGDPVATLVLLAKNALTRAGHLHPNFETLHAVALTLIPHVDLTVDTRNPAAAARTLARAAQHQNDPRTWTIQAAHGFSDTKLEAALTILEQDPTNRDAARIALARTARALANTISTVT